MIYIGKKLVALEDSTQNITKGKKYEVKDIQNDNRYKGKKVYTVDLDILKDYKFHEDLLIHFFGKQIFNIEEVDNKKFKIL